jgi:frataxin-like iron-binding protein CyaY
VDLKTLERAVAEDPKNPDARLALGEALVEAGRGSDALDHLRQALLLRRDSFEAYLALGKALLSEGEQIAAIATLEGGREMARKTPSAGEWVPRFDEALTGLGPVKRRSTAPLDDAAFDALARSTLESIARRVRALGGAIEIQQSPTVVVLAAPAGKLGLSEQRTSREIWCSSSLGELRFRYIPSSSRWRAAEGEELISTVGEFLSRALGSRVSLEAQ